MQRRMLHLRGNLPQHRRQPHPQRGRQLLHPFKFVQTDQGPQRSGIRPERIRPRKLRRLVQACRAAYFHGAAESGTCHVVNGKPFPTFLAAWQRLRLHTLQAGLAYSHPAHVHQRPATRPAVRRRQHTRYRARGTLPGAQHPFGEGKPRFVPANHVRAHSKACACRGRRRCSRFELPVKRLWEDAPRSACVRYGDRAALVPVPAV